MANIFLSYASDDRDRVRPLVEALEADGHDVWWDREIKPGPSFDREIERAIAAADCLVVVWSERSVESEWVRSEVEEGVRRNVLVPVLLDDVLPPLAYRRRQAANLDGWDGERSEGYLNLLAGIEATATGTSLHPAENAAAPPPRRKSGRRPLGRRARSMVQVGAAAGLLGGVAAGLGLGYWFEPAPAPPEPLRFEITLPAGLSISENLHNPLAVTPDGGRVVFSAWRERGGDSYHLRDLDTLGVREIPAVGQAGTNLGSLWLSPDGDWLVFNDPTDRTYKKVQVSGGATVPIAPTGLEAGGVRGLTWGTSGDLVYSNTAQAGLMRVPEGLGAAEALTTPTDDIIHYEPRFLPARQALVYVAAPEEDPESGMVRVLDLASGEDRELVPGRRPLVTTSGHLLVYRDGTLWAAAFDPDRLELLGRMVPVVEGLSPIWAATGFDVAANGTLVYLPDLRNEQGRELVWLNVDGSRESLPLNALSNLLYPRLSPDGNTLLISNFSSDRGIDLWTHDFTRQVTTRITFDEQLNVETHWSADGQSIIYTSRPADDDDALFTLLRRPMDGAPQVEVLAEPADGRSHFATGVSPDGERILLQVCRQSKADCDLGHLERDREILVHATEVTEGGTAAASPDGNWVAYVSGAAGEQEVQVTNAYAPGQDTWRISLDGGAVPVWSQDGQTLYYVEPESNLLMAVAVDTADGSFRASRPEEHMDLTGMTWRQGPGSGAPNFDIDASGERVLAIQGSASSSRMVVVLNWYTELQRLAPHPD